MSTSSSYPPPTDHELHVMLTRLTTEENAQLITLTTMLIEARTTGTYEAAYLYAHSILLQARERRGDTPEQAMSFVTECMRSWAHLPGVPGKEAIA